MRYTDAHVHFGQRGEFDAAWAVTALIDEMNRNEIEQVFLFPIGSEVVRNETMLRAVREHRSRLIPFAWLSPLKEGQLEWFIERMEEGSIRGLKLHPYSDRYRIDNLVLLKPWMETVGRHHSHVIVHCTSNDEYCSPRQMEALVKSYPDITFQMAHMGAIWQCREALEMIRENPNLYGDTSIASYSANVRAGAQIADRLLMGTDYPFYRFEMEHLKIQLAIEDPQAREKVVYRNFKKIAERIC